MIKIKGLPSMSLLDPSCKAWWQWHTGNSMDYWKGVYRPEWVERIGYSSKTKWVKLLGKLGGIPKSHMGKSRLKFFQTRNSAFKIATNGSTSGKWADLQQAPPFNIKIDGNLNVMNIGNTKFAFISERGMKFSKPISLSKEKYRYGTCYQMRIYAWTIMIDVLKPANILVSHSTGARDNDKPPQPD